MTLQESVRSIVGDSKLVLHIPEDIAKLSLLNANLFCALKIKRYYESNDFFKDLYAISESIQISIEHGYDGFFLFFDEDVDGNLVLKIDIEYFYLQRTY